jgi:multiple sugar transport system permease protein
MSVHKTRRLARLRASLLPYLLTVPALLFVAAVVVYPIISNVVNSLETDYRAIQGASGVKFVGLANYIGAWNQGLMQTSLSNSFRYTIGVVALSFLLGFGCALLLNQLVRTQTLYRVLIVLPWVISPVIAGFTWRWLLSDKFGYLNAALLGLHIIKDPIIWLGDTNLAFLSVIFAGTWRMFPFVMIMILAGLQQVSQELLEAAEIDGASSAQRFRHVTVPQVRSVLVVIILLGFLWTFNDFGVIQIMTQGGPLDATMVLPVLIRTVAFKHLRMGTASALSLLLAAVLLALSIVYLRFAERDVD